MRRLVAIALLAAACSGSPGVTPAPTTLASLPPTVEPTSAPPSSPPTSAAPSRSTDRAALIATICAPPAYSSCTKSLTDIPVFLDGASPGTLLAVCASGNDTGDVVKVFSGKEADAETECSGGGLISPSSVVRVVRVP